MNAQTSSSTEQIGATDAYLQDPRFSQTFTLPPGPDRPEPFNITYSDYGYRNPTKPDQEHVVLFCGPLLSSRYFHVAKDKLAKKYRVRIIHPDRPGMGGTTEVDAKDSLRVWLEIVTGLMQHLGVSRITLVCQSAGTLYALHTALHLRHLLHPERPYFAMCGPWVHPEHSGVKLMALSNALPVTVLSKFDSAARIINATMGPILGFSDVLSSSLMPSWSTREPTSVQPAAADMAEFEKKLRPHIMKRVYAENYQGMSQDVLLVMKKGLSPSSENDEGAWGDWGDVDKYVPMLAKREEEMRQRQQQQQQQQQPSLSAPIQLDVEIFFAESDNMIGNTKGPQWLKDCWRPEQRGEAISFQSHIIGGADHDGIFDLSHGVAERIFRKISGQGEAIDE